MRIHAHMNLDDLAERMGTCATEAEAITMRDLLAEQFEGQDTADIEEDEWLTMLDQVAGIGDEEE